MRLLSFVGILCLGALVAGTHAYQDKKKGVPTRPLPFAGNGTCDEPTTEDGYTRVRCLGPEMPMLPGQTIDAYIILASPYPTDKNVTLVRQTSQMVARTGKNSWREVPLSELYFHHVVPDPRFLQAEGAEVRGSRLREPVSYPYAYIVDGKDAAEVSSRRTNLQLVNTIGVSKEHLQKSFECWCGHDELGEPSTRGSLFCCKQSPTNSTAGPEFYQLEYNITFRDVKKGERPIQVLGYDASGGQLEYNIVVPSGPNTTHTTAIETTVDKDCPQSEEFTIIRCGGHQHIGSKCMHAYDLDAGVHICSTCSMYGNETDAPGNELGYVVAIPDADIEYKIKPGTRIRVESVYDASQKRLGVMGLLGLWVGDLKDECPPRFKSMSMRELAQNAAVTAAA